MSECRSFFLQLEDCLEPVTLRISSVLCVGFSGRNRDAVDAHIAELAALGVAPPERIPAIYPVTRGCLTTAGEIEVQAGGTSGEVEFVLITQGDRMFVTVGSDHTDRVLERVDVLRSKQVCPKVVAPIVWSWDEVRDHWDDLELRAEIAPDTFSFRTYQVGRVSELLHPDQLLKEIRDYLGRPPEDAVIFGGTIPVEGSIQDAKFFRFELRNPVRGRRIRHTYRVRAVLDRE